MANNVFAILDTEITPELAEEGIAREIVSKIQQMRKQKDFEMMDNIRIYLSADQEVKDVAGKYADYIKSETLAVSIEEKSGLDEVNINGHKTGLDVERV